MTAARLETAKDLAVTLVVATAGGLAFTWAGLPVAWLAGPALFTAALTTLRHRSNQLPRSFRTLAQVAIGVTIGASFPPDAPELLSHHALAIALSLGATLVLGLGAGSILGRWAGLDRPTALLASSPGGASGLVAISNELGANPLIVATMHYLRVFVIVTLVPFAAVYLAQFSPRGTVTLPAGPMPTGLADAGAALPVPGVATLPALAALLVAAAGAGWLLHRLGIPAGWFLGPITAGLIAKLAELPIPALPEPLLDTALLLIGASIGTAVDLGELRRSRRVFVAAAVLVVVLLVGCTLTAYLLHRVTGLDLATAILALVPGGIDIMIPTALALGADMGWVTVMQVLRVLLMMFMIPWLAHTAVPRAAAVKHR